MYSKQSIAKNLTKVSVIIHVLVLLVIFLLKSRKFRLNCALYPNLGIPWSLLWSIMSLLLHSLDYCVIFSLKVRDKDSRLIQLLIRLSQVSTGHLDSNTSDKEKHIMVGKLNLEIRRDVLTEEKDEARTTSPNWNAIILYTLVTLLVKALGLRRFRLFPKPFLRGVW